MVQVQKPKDKIDYRQDITNEIIELMEKGNLPWQKPWNSKIGNTFQKPFNAVTQRHYQGANSLYLLTRQSKLNALEDPRWCTFKQASEKGWKIKKGAKATTVEYWKFEEIDKNPEDNKETNPKEDKLEPSQKVSVFYAKIFHASQIEGIPKYIIEKEKPISWNPSETAERILKNSGAKIYHDQLDSAFYRPSTDAIHLPNREAFPEMARYYSTALHELGHWTGAENRLNRNLKSTFGSKEYAKEELRAEMSSLYSSIEVGLPFDPSAHAAYTSSWIKVLKNDKHEFFRAAKDAEKITDYIIQLSQKKELTNELPLKTIAEIIEFKLPEQVRKPILAQEYKLKLKDYVLRKIEKNEPFNSDLEIAQKLLEKGYSKIKVADVLNRQSPFNHEKSKIYGNQLIKTLDNPIKKTSRRL